MNLTFTTSKPNSVYINNNYVTIAESANLVSIIFPLGATFITPVVPLDSIGLVYDSSANPVKITGDPSGAFFSSLIPIQLVPTPFGDFDNDFNDDFSGLGTGAENITLEVVKPTFTAVPTECACSVVLTDTMELYNPAITGGTITYYIQANNVWVPLGVISKGGSVTVSGGCDFGFGTFPIKAVYNTVNFQSEYTTTITFTEYRPSLNLSYTGSASCAGDCCGAIIDQDVTVHAEFDTRQTTGTSTLTWTVYDNAGNPVGSPTVVTIDNTDPGSANHNFVFTPNGKMDYTVKAVLDNGCAPCIKTIVIKTCDYISLIQVAGGCNLYRLANCSLSLDSSYSVFDATTSGIVSGFQNLPLLHNTTANILMPADGIYYISVYNPDNSVRANYPVVADCGIKSCLTEQFNKAYCKDCKCKEQKGGCGCSDISKILPLAYMFYSYVNKIYTLHSTFDMMDEATITTLQTLVSTMDKLKTYCKNCGPAKKGKNCGCK
jgi:hypothetical protein